MTDELDGRLKERLQALENAVPPVPAGLAVPLPTAQVRSRTDLRLGLALAALAVLILAVMRVGMPLQPGAPSRSPLPPGGLREQEAVARASEFVAPGSALVSARASRIGDVPGAGESVAADRLVWAVTFSVRLEHCVTGPSPAPTACVTPKPGRWTVILDYTTGDKIVSFGESN